MNGSDNSEENSKTSSTSKNEYEDEGEEVADNSKPKNRSSSNNSTVEENEKKAASGSVRHYVRSKNPRLRWTPDLHLRFVHAVERLGGQDRATPKLVLEWMNIKGLSIAHVKSHLQMYRSKKIDDPNQVLSGQRLMFDGGDHNIYNLSQLPMLQSFNQKPTSSLSYERYGDALWGTSHQNQIYNACMGGAASKGARDGPYFSTAERVFGGINGISPNYDFHLDNPFNGQASRKILEGQEELPSWRTQIRPRLMESIRINNLQSVEKSSLSWDRNWRVTSEEQRTVKRKAADSDCNLDLNLSLKVTPKNDEFDKGMEVEEVDSSLSLTLFSSSSSKYKRLEKSDGSTKHGRTAGTLDLTL